MYDRKAGSVVTDCNLDEDSNYRLLSPIQNHLARGIDYRRGEWLSFRAGLYEAAAEESSTIDHVRL